MAAQHAQPDHSGAPYHTSERRAVGPANKATALLSVDWLGQKLYMTQSVCAAVQKAAGSALRASMFSRQSMMGARQSMAAANKPAVQPAQPAQLDHSAIIRHTVEHDSAHSFTGDFLRHHQGPLYAYQSIPILGALDEGLSQDV